MIDVKLVYLSTFTSLNCPSRPSSISPSPSPHGSSLSQSGLVFGYGLCGFAVGASSIRFTTGTTTSSSVLSFSTSPWLSPANSTISRLHLRRSTHRLIIQKVADRTTKPSTHTATMSVVRFTIGVACAESESSTLDVGVEFARESSGWVVTGAHTCGGSIV